VRRLAEAHRSGSEVADDEAVLLNQPYLGSQEILAAGAQFRELGLEADAAGLRLGAVQAEFLREYLLGAEATARLHEPGTDWVDEDRERVDALAHACKRAWDAFRDGA
jgi:hypothetical protein